MQATLIYLPTNLPYKSAIHVARSINPLVILKIFFFLELDAGHGVNNDDRMAVL